MRPIRPAACRGATAVAHASRRQGILSVVTTPKIPRTEPARSRSLATEWDQLAASARTTRILAGGALLVALGALGLAAWQLAAAPATCQREAWAVTPATGTDLPEWTSVTQYDTDGKSMRFVGPLPPDEFTPQAEIIATVTCFPRGAAESVTLSREAAEAADQAVMDRRDLGEQAFSAADPSGATFLQLRTGRIVVYIAGSAETSATQVDQVASAFDIALGGDGGDIAPVTPPPSDDLGFESLDPGETFPEESQAAPELIARLPSRVGDITLGADSATGSTFLGEDQGSRAVLAALREAGLKPDDLRVAQAYDERAESDLSILLVAVGGMPGDETQELVMDVWLAATGAGVTRAPLEMAGRAWTRVDYGDGGMIDYVLTEDDTVLVITTADPELAEQVAAALP